MSWFAYALLGALVASCSTMLEKRTLEHVHSFAFSAVLALFAALCTAPIMYEASWSGITLPILASILFASAIASTAYFTVTKGLRHLEVSVASPILLLSPLVTTILAFITLNERISATQMVGMVTLMFGLYLLETHDITDWGDFCKNIYGSSYTRYMLVGVFLYGVSSLIDRVVLGTYHIVPELYTALVQLCIAVCIIVWSLTFRRDSLPLMKETIIEHWHIIALIAVLTSTYRTLQAHAVALASVGVVIAVKRSSALFTTVIGGELFHDDNLLRKSVACIIMIGGVYLLTIGT